jgi:hypothetical protein
LLSRPVHPASPKHPSGREGSWEGS